MKDLEDLLRVKEYTAFRMEFHAQQYRLLFAGRLGSLGLAYQIYLTSDVESMESMPSKLNLHRATDLAAESSVHPVKQCSNTVQVPDAYLDESTVQINESTSPSLELSDVPA